MSVIIQRQDEFYDFSEKEFRDLKNYAGGLSFDDQYKTKERDFPIGSRVFIEHIGWTEIKEGFCDNCSLNSDRHVCEDLPLMCGRNRGDGKYVIFVTIDPEPIAIDYRELLKKYMAHIFLEEGISYLDRSVIGVSDSDFTELEKIYNEALQGFKDETK